MAGTLYINGTDAGVTVQRLTPGTIGEVSLPYAVVPGMPGGVAGPVSYGPKRFSVNCWIKAGSEALTTAALDAFRAKLAAMDDTELSLRFECFESDRYWLARLASEPKITRWRETFYELDVEFIAPNPVAYDVDEVEETDALTNPLTVSYTPGGSAWTWPTYQIETDGSHTPAYSVVVANATTSVGVRWSFTLEAGQWLRFSGDPLYQWVERSADSGATWTSVMGNVTSLSERTIPYLLPGVANSITVTGASSGTLRTTYRNRYK